MYLLSALGVGALWVVPLLWLERHYRREDCPSNVVTFPQRDATVTQIHRNKGGAA